MQPFSIPTFSFTIWGLQPMEPIPTVIRWRQATPGTCRQFIARPRRKTDKDTKPLRLFRVPKLPQLHAFGLRTGTNQANGPTSSRQKVEAGGFSSKASSQNRASGAERDQARDKQTRHGDWSKWTGTQKTCLKACTQDDKDSPARKTQCGRV